MDKGLTFKQRKFKRELLRTGLPTEAAFRAYNCKDRLVARVIASQLLTKLNINYSELLDTMGLTDERDTSDLIALREANKIQSCDIYVKKENGETVLNKNSNDFIEVEDNHVRAKALELTFKLKKRFNGEAPVIDASTHYHFTKITDAKLIDEARKKGIDLSPGIEARIGQEIPQQQD